VRAVVDDKIDRLAATLRREDFSEATLVLLIDLVVEPNAILETVGGNDVAEVRFVGEVNTHHARLRVHCCKGNGATSLEDSYIEDGDWNIAGKQSRIIVENTFSL
jgi:hypothetical protein